MTHYGEHDRGKPYQCDDCGERFSTFRGLQRHDCDGDDTQ